MVVNACILDHKMSLPHRAPSPDPSPDKSRASSSIIGRSAPSIDSGFALNFLPNLNFLATPLLMMIMIYNSNGDDDDEDYDDETNVNSRVSGLPAFRTDVLV